MTNKIDLQLDHSIEVTGGGNGEGPTETKKTTLSTILSDIAGFVDFSFSDLQFAPEALLD